MRGIINRRNVYLCSKNSNGKLFYNQISCIANSLNNVFQNIELHSIGIGISTAHTYSKTPNLLDKCICSVLFMHFIEQGFE